ncbi:MAG: RDD family protein [Phyllobacteriaceae bacterium]|nr:RDD family protein [Phyllobacteriaceae bacterium]
MNQSGYTARDSFERYGASPRLEGVRTRRVLAFIVDYLIVAVLTMIAMVAVFFIGILTFGLGWLLYFVLAPLIAMAYVGSTMGGPAQATPGMQFFSIRIERDDGVPVDFFLAILHGVIFWVAHITLTPFMLLIALFSERKRLIQDILLGTAVVRSDIG